MAEWTLIDTETDGLYGEIHIVEIAAQRFSDMEPVGQPFRVFLNHNVPMPADAFATHGYSAEFLEIEGIQPEDAYTAFRAYARGAIVSHYMRFDWHRALMPELLRLGIDPIGYPGFCTWMLSRRVLFEHPTHRLDYLRDTLNLACSGPHSAKGDVESTIDMLVRFVFPRLHSIGVKVFGQIDQFSRLNPMILCKYLLEGVSLADASKMIAEEKREKQRIYRLINGIQTGSRAVPELLVECELIEDHPEIVFPNSTFLFTGTLARCSRAEAMDFVLANGGLLAKSKSVSKELDYLVLGEAPTGGWTSLLHGNKLREAFVRRIKNPDYRFKIVREEDFFAALPITK